MSVQDFPIPLLRISSCLLYVDAVVEWIYDTWSEVLLDRVS